MAKEPGYLRNKLLRDMLGIGVDEYKEKQKINNLQGTVDRLANRSLVKNKNRGGTTSILGPKLEDGSMGYNIPFTTSKQKTNAKKEAEKVNTAKKSSNSAKKSNSKYTKIFGDIAKQAGDDSAYKNLMKKKAALDFRNRIEKKLQEQKTATNTAEDKPIEGETQKDRRFKKRLERKARRRALRSGAPEGSDQYKANLQSEKDLIKKRRARRNEFLRQFASQLSRGEQAAPRPSEYDGETDPSKMFTNKNKTDGQKATEKNAETEKENIKTRLDRTKQQDNSFMSFLDSSGVGSDLGNYGLGDSVEGPMSLGDYQRSFQNLNPGIPKLDTEDSTPQSAMRKEYNKKRGL